MTSNDPEPNLDDVLATHESAHPDRRAHAKTPKHVDDAELQRRTQEEREAVESPDN